MSIEVQWVPTDKHVYATIYREHSEALTVFSAHTCNGGCVFDSEPRMDTAWGFKGADAPLIRCESRGDRTSKDCRWSYWIALVKHEPDE